MPVLSLCLKAFLSSNRHSIILLHNLRLLEPAGRSINGCTVLNSTTTQTFTNEENEKENVKKKKLFIKSDGTVVNKMLPFTRKITMIDTNGSKSTIYLEEAEKMAKRNNCELVKLDQKEGNKDVYRLTKGGEMLYHMSPQNKTKVKKIMIGGEILDHDFQLKLNQIHKLLVKKKPVMVLLERNKSNFSKIENLSEVIQNKFKSDFKISKKSEKALGISFTIMPQDKKDKSNNDDSMEKPS